MATGGASKRPDADSAGMLTRAELILNALDADQAGATATARFWDREFPQAKRWPTPPSRKDAGEAVGSIDIREWIRAVCHRVNVAQSGAGQSPAPAVQLKPEQAAPSKAEQYTRWYMGIVRELLRLMRGTPIMIDGDSGLAQAPQKWSMERENWDRLRAIDEIMRQGPAVDLVLEAGKGLRHVSSKDLEQAAPRLEKMAAAVRERRITGP